MYKRAIASCSHFKDVPMLRFVLTLIVFCLWSWPVLAQPKLVHFGWDNPTIESLPAILEKLETSVFDGLSISSPGHDHVFSSQAATAESYAAEAAILKALKPGLLSNSYLVVHAATDDVFDWNNEAHWATSLSNMRNLVALAKTGKLKGVVLDMEPYGKSPWDYRSQGAKDTLAFSAFQDLLYRRGQDMMAVMQKEYPGLDVWCLYGLSANTYLLNDPASVITPNAVLAEDGYGLWPSFFGGMVKAADASTRIIDGNEPSYYYTRSEAFAASHKTIKQDLARFLNRDAQARYAGTVKLGHAVYVDGVMNSHESPRFIGYYFKSDSDRLELLARNLANALKSSESLVWVYAERTRWWQDTPRADIDRAIRTAKNNIQETAAIPVSKALKSAENALASRITIGGFIKNKDGRGLRIESFGSVLNDAACSSWGDGGEYACEFPKGATIELRPRVKGLSFEPAVRRLKSVSKTQYGVDWDVR
jgi:hypothetical protein